MLRLVARRGRVEVEVAAAGAGRRRGAGPGATGGGAGGGAGRRLAALAAQLREDAAPLAQRKSDLLARAAAPGLWDDRAAAQALYDEVYRIDGVFAALDELARSAGEQVDALRRRCVRDRDLSAAEERLDALEAQSRHVAFLVSCRNRRDLGDAFIVLTLVSAQGGGLDAVALLRRCTSRWRSGVGWRWKCSTTARAATRVRT